MSDLSSIERLKFEALFDMESGYVLDFSNNTFSAFTIENVGIDIFDSKYEYGSSSKANRLRKFWLEEPNEVVGRLLAALLDYWLMRKQTSEAEFSIKEKTLYDECQKIAKHLTQFSFRQNQENTSSSSQKGRIFISYRRIDSEAWAGRIYDRLTPHFGGDAIFMDVDDIPAGVDFVNYLENEVQSCDVLIALIGKQWLNVKDAHGIRRLDDPNDFVRIEIATALKRDVRVIPVLLGGAQMPNISDLPENLQSLTRRNGVLVYHHSFHADTNRLIKHLEAALGAAEKDAQAKSEKEAAEKARLQAEAEEEERQRIVKEKAEREAVEKAAREKAEKEESEKARLEAEELARQKAAKEKAEREATEKAARKKAGREAEKDSLEKQLWLDRLYAEGLAAFYAEDWDKANQCFQTILKEQPDNKNATEKLVELERQKESAEKVAREKAWIESSEKIQLESAKRAEAAKREALAKSEREASEKAAIEKAEKANKRKLFFLRLQVIWIGIVFLIGTIYAIASLTSPTKTWYVTPTVSWLPPVPTTDISQLLDTMPTKYATPFPTLTIRRLSYFSYIREIQGWNGLPTTTGTVIIFCTGCDQNLDEFSFRIYESSVELDIDSDAWEYIKTITGDSFSAYPGFWYKAELQNDPNSNKSYAGPGKIKCCGD